jgi:hypothetical protein
VLYEIIAYVIPGLTKAERQFLAPIVFGSSILFYAGCAHHSNDAILRLQHVPARNPRGLGIAGAHKSDDGCTIDGCCEGAGAGQSDGAAFPPR